MKVNSRFHPKLPLIPPNFSKGFDTLEKFPTKLNNCLLISFVFKILAVLGINCPKFINETAFLDKAVTPVFIITGACVVKNVIAVPNKAFPAAIIAGIGITALPPRIF
jgi:hypothetical protein